MRADTRPRTRLNARCAELLQPKRGIELAEERRRRRNPSQSDAGGRGNERGHGRLSRQQSGSRQAFAARFQRRDSGPLGSSGFVVSARRGQRIDASHPVIFSRHLVTGVSACGNSRRTAVPDTCRPAVLERDRQEHQHGDEDGCRYSAQDPHPAIVTRIMSRRTGSPTACGSPPLLYVCWRLGTVSGASISFSFRRRRTSDAPSLISSLPSGRRRARSDVPPVW